MTCNLLFCLIRLGFQYFDGEFHISIWHIYGKRNIERNLVKQDFSTNEFSFDRLGQLISFLNTFVWTEVPLKRLNR